MQLFKRKALVVPAGHVNNPVCAVPVLLVRFGNVPLWMPRYDSVPLSMTIPLPPAALVIAMVGVAVVNWRMPPELVMALPVVVGSL